MQYGVLAVSGGSLHVNGPARPTVHPSTTQLTQPCQHLAVLPLYRPAALRLDSCMRRGALHLRGLLRNHVEMLQPGLTAWAVAPSEYEPPRWLIQGQRHDVSSGLPQQLDPALAARARVRTTCSLTLCTV